MKRAILAAAVAALSFVGFADAPGPVPSPEPGDASSASYLKDGLVGQWDGIDNVIVGGQRMHSDTPDKWYDLSGNGYDGTFASSSTLTWDENSWKNETKTTVPVTAPADFCARIANKVYTVEFLVEPSQDMIRFCYFSQWNGTKGFGLEQNASGQLRVGYFSLPVEENWNAGTPSIPKDKVTHVAVTASNGVHVVYLNGARAWSATGNANLATAGDIPVAIGGEIANRDKMAFCGRWYTCRAYDRALSADEVAENYRVDDVRYVSGGSILLPLELRDGELVATLPASGAERTATLYWGGTYGGTNEWASTSTPVTIPAGATTVSFAKPSDWSRMTWYARVKIGEGDFVRWSRTLVAEPPAPLGVEKPTLASSAFGSSEIAAQVTGIGATASEATLLFKYGAAPDALDNTIQVTVTDAGEYRATIPRLAAGTHCCVQATISNNQGEGPVSSAVFEFDQPVVAEPGEASSASYQKNGLVAQWDGIDNVIVDGQRMHSSEPDKWHDLSGNGYDATFSSPNQLVWEEDGWTNDSDSRPAYAPAAVISSAMADKEFTVEFLVKPVSTTRRATIFGQYSWGNFGIEHNSGGASDGGIRLYYGTPDIYAYASDIKVCQDVVSSVAYTTSGGEHKLYLNGVHVFTNTGSNIPDGVPNRNKDLIIGGEPDRGNMSFRGKFYTMRIYDQALSAGEIAENYRIDRRRFVEGVRGSQPLELQNGQLVTKVPLSASVQKVFFYAGATYGGVDGWGNPVAVSNVAAGVTSVSFPKPAGWGSSVWFARVKIGEGDDAVWSKTTMPELSAPLGVEKPTYVSSVFGSSVVAAEVTGLGTAASAATLTFSYGTTPDCSDGLVEVDVTDAGEWRGAIPHCIAGQTYYVKAVLTNTQGEGPVESDVTSFVQPETAEAKGDLSSFYMATNCLVAWWDGVNNAGMGQHDASATSWTDLSGNGHTLGSFVSGVTWTDNAFATPTKEFSTAAKFTGTAVGIDDYKAYEIVFSVDGELPKSAALIFGFGNFKGLAPYSGTSGKSRGFLVKSNEGIFRADYDVTGRLQQFYVDFNASGKADKGYLDGTALVQTTDSDNWNQGTSGIGYSSNANWPYYGRIGALRLYDRPLTDEEREWNLSVDNARFAGGPSPLELKLQDGQLVLTVPPSVASDTTVSLFAGEDYGGTDGWGAAVQTKTLQPGETSVGFSLPENWGSSVWFARAKVGTGDAAAWSKTLIASAANTPAVSLDSLDGLGGDTMIVKGAVDALGGESCTLTVLTGTSADAITQDWDDLEGLAVTETGDFEFELFESNPASPRYLSPGGTYYVKIVATAPNGRAAWSSVKSVKMAGAAAFMTVSAPTFDKRTMTVTASMSDVGMGGKTMIELWVGADAGSLAKAAGPVEVTTVGQNFTLSYRLPAFETPYVWELRASNASAGLTANPTTPSAQANATAPDSAIYTWTGKGGDGKWSTKANWSDNKGGDCLGYPQTASATACINQNVTVDVDVKVAINTLDINDYNGLVITFTSTDTSTCGLTVNNVVQPTKDSHITLDHVTIDNKTSGGQWNFQGNTVFELKNGADYTHRAGFWLGCTADNSLLLSGRSKMLVTSWLYMARNACIEIDDSELKVNSNPIHMPYDSGDSLIRIKGAAPKFIAAGEFQHLNKAGSNSTFEFVVPVGGWAEAPIVANGGFNKSSGVLPMVVRISDDSPAARVDDKLEAMPLVQGTIGKANVTTVGFTDESLTSDFVWGGETATPPSLAVTIIGNAHGDRLEIEGVPVAYCADKVSPTYNIYNEIAQGRALTLSAPSGNQMFDDQHGVACTGWKLYTVDSVTYERTEVAQGDTQSTNYVHDGVWRVLEWQWRTFALLGLGRELVRTSSGVGTTEVTANVTGIGESAASATLTFSYGTSQDDLSGSVAVSDIVETGTYSVQIPTPTAGETYYVQATLSNGTDPATSSDVLEFTRVEAVDQDVMDGYAVPTATRVPNDYEELPYIIADGGYVETPICPDTDTRVTATVRTENTDDKMIYGVRNNGLGWIYWVGSSCGNLYSLVFNNYTSGGTTMSDVAEKSVFSIDVSKNGLFVNGKERVSAATLKPQATGAKSTRPMMFFALRDGANIDSRHFEGECYGFTVYTNNDVKAIDYVPARERADGGRVGFWDTVNGAFVVSDVANKPFKPGTGEVPALVGTHTLFVRGTPNEERVVAPAFGEYRCVRPGEVLRFATFAGVVVGDAASVCAGYEVYTIAGDGTKTLVKSGPDASFELEMPDADTEVLWKWTVNAPVGVKPQLAKVSSEFGSSVVSAEVTGLGKTASKATLAFKYGTTPDVADGETAVTVTDVGVWQGTLSHLQPGQTYYVKATISNDQGEGPVESDVFSFVQPEVAEPGIVSPGLYAQQDHLVAFWDGLDNVGVGLSDRSATTWTDLTGNGFDWTLNSDTSRYEWTDRGLRLKGVGLVGSLATKKVADFDNKITTIEFIYANGAKRDAIVFSPGFGASTYLYTDRNGHVGFYGVNYNDNAGTTAALGEMNCYSVVYTRTGPRPTGVKKFWVNGTETTAEKMVDYWPVSAPALGGQSDKDRAANGELLAIRIYDVELTDAEREQNRSVDDLRYFQGVNGALPLEFANGALVLTVPASDAVRTAVLCWGETYGGTNTWTGTSGEVEIPAGATTVSFPKPEGWGRSVWFARAKVGEGDSAHWSKTLMPEPPAPLGMSETLALASSVFGSSEIAAQVTGIGKTASEATLTFAYGTTPDLADGTVQLTVTDAGEWRGTIPHCIAGQTYYVQATLSSGQDVAAVESEVFKFVQPEVVEPGVFTSDSYVKKGLVAQWDGIDNAGRGAHNPTATSWADLSGNNHTLGNFVSGVTWTDNAYATPTTAYSTSATITGTEVGVYDFQSYEIVFAADKEVPNSGAQIFATGGFKGLVLIKNASKRGFQIREGGRFFLCDYDTTGQLQQLYADYAGDDTPDTAFYGGAALDTTTYSEGWGSGGFRFGYSGTSYPFYGRICSIRLYGRKLTAAEREQNRLADAMRYNRGLDGGLPIELKDGQFTVTVPASDEARKATFCWGETYGGVGDWASTAEVTIPAGATTVSCAQPALWGSSVWFARAKIGEGDDAVWSKTLVAADANLPQATLADARAHGLEKFVLSGTLDAFVGGSCTLTPVVIDSTGAAIDFSAAAQEMTEPGEFGFTLPTEIAEDETYSICVEMTAGGRAARSKTIVVKTGTVGTLTPLAPEATAQIVVTVEDSPEGFTTASPDYGRYAAEANKVYAFTATASQTIDGRAYRLQGYEVYDDGADEPVTSGEDNSFTFASDRGGFRVVWLWDVDYATTVEVSGGNGTALANQPSVKHGDTASFTATPAAGYAVMWTGDVPNEQMFGNVLELKDVKEPVHVVASFFEPSANPPDAPKAGLFADYARSLPIDFTGYEGETALADFPALIRLHEGKAGFSYQNCAADGRDVRFCGADGQELDSEIASWNPNGTSEFWVKVPSLTKTTRIYLVYDNADAPKRTPGTYAFNEGYRGVWTMESAKNLLLDRSVYGQHAACDESEITSIPAGVVGGARRFSGTKNTSLAFLGVGAVAPMEPKDFTAECWFKLTDYPVDCTYFLGSGMRSYGGSNQASTFGIDSEGRIFGANNGGYQSGTNPSYAWAKNASASKGQWHHAAYTQAANGEEFVYLDGVMVGCYTNVMADYGWGGAFYYNTWDKKMARQGNPTLGAWQCNIFGRTSDRFFAGDMDEARLSGEVRSADWVRATYQTVAESETFAVFGRPVYKLTVDGVAQPVAPAIAATTPAVVEANGVRTTCLGYEIVADGACIASDDVCTVSHAWPRDAHSVAVRWLRTVEYKVNDDYAEPGSLVRVTAPDAPAGQAFHSWGGDCPTLEVFTASFDLPADRPRTLTPVYAPLTEVTTNGCADAAEAGAALHTALEAAVAAGTPQVVLVGDGVYEMTNAVKVTTPVVVRSVNGFEKTKLVQTTNFRYFELSHPGALVKGFDFECVGGNAKPTPTIASVTEGHLDGCRFAVRSGLSFSYTSAYYLTQSGGWCRNCVFLNFEPPNGVSDRGGAGIFSHMLMDGCVITNMCTVVSPILVNPNALIRNTLIAKNSPGSNINGGAARVSEGIIVLNTSGIAFENCTIADNKNFSTTTSAAKGGGIYADYPLLVVNTILSGNKANSAALGDDFYGPVAAVHSMSKDFTGGEFGSMTALPAYVQDEDGTTDPLYRPRGVSPSRDAGYPTVWSRSLGAWDLLGSNRVDEAEVDIGACEYAPSETEEFDVSVVGEGDVSGFDRAEIAFRAILTGAKGEVTYAWDFGDGTTSTEANPTHVYTHGGWYTVRLEVSDEGGHSAVYVSPAPIKVKPSVCYINDAGSATPPYATRETGANGDSALPDVLGGQPPTIVICSNTVAKNIRGTVTQVGYPVTIMGEDRETSTIKNEVNVTDPGAVISSLTYTGGDGYCTGFSVSKALVTNVVFRDAALYYNGNGFALEADEGTRIVDSVFVNTNPNHVQGNVGGAALRIVGKGVVVDRCVITNNFSTSGAKTYAAGIRVAGAYDPMPVIRNSFIGYNRCFDAGRTNAVGGAGIYAEGPVRVENCTIVSNQTCGAGSAIYVTAGTAEIVNTIIACNAGGLTNAAEICSNEVYVAEGASVAWTRSRVPAEAGISGEEVTTADPKFNFGRRASVPYWGILGDSPLKNKGVKLEWMTPGTKDIGGQKRVFNAKPDLGCYESQIGGTVIIVR